MERLTEKIGNTNCVKGCGSNCKYGFEYCSEEDWENCKTIDDVIDKLAEYEDLEEQGRLIKLPCKAGDAVYRINIGAMKPVIPLRVVEYRFKIVGNCIREKICCSDDFLCKQPSIIYYAEDIGNKAFLTKSEAEAKLKELRGREDDSMEP